MEKLNELSSYYKDKGLAIIGLNDSQGVNVTSTFFKKGLLEYISAALKDEELRPIVINAFSLTMNKTEHIDYFLESNLSLEEIKLSQIYSVVSALEKVMEDVKMPRILGKIGNLYRMVYTPKKGDENIFIADTIRDIQEPTLIYSSGVNNLMREVGISPFTIMGDYKNRDIKPNYNYTVVRSNDPRVLKSVIDGIEKNFDSILNINDKTDIYTLGAYVPKALESEGMGVFRDLVSVYNEKLEYLCRRYNISFINTDCIGKKYNKSKENFRITTEGHNALADHILHNMYQRKIGDKSSQSPYIKAENFQETDGLDGPFSVYRSLKEDHYKTMVQSLLENEAYSKQRQYVAIMEEHNREAYIFSKVMRNSRTIR